MTCKGEKHITATFFDYIFLSFCFVWIHWIWITHRRVGQAQADNKVGGSCQSVLGQYNEVQIAPLWWASFLLSVCEWVNEWKWVEKTL